jgi:Tfp pilus assembly protein PilF
MLDRLVSSSAATYLTRAWRASAAVLALSPLVFLVQQRIARDSSPAQVLAEFGSQIALSQQLLQGGSARESLVPLERARRLRPQAFAVHNNLCFAYGLLGRKADAVAACQRALEQEPDNQLARNNLSWVRKLTENSPR